MVFNFHEFVQRSTVFYSEEKFKESPVAWLYYDGLFENESYSFWGTKAVLVSEPIEFNYTDCNSQTGEIDKYVYVSDYRGGNLEDINVEMFCFLKGLESNGLKLADLYISMAGGDLKKPVFFQISYYNYMKFLIDKNRDDKRYTLAALRIGHKSYDITNKYHEQEFCDFNDYELQKFIDILNTYPFIQKTFFSPMFIDAKLFNEVIEQYIRAFEMHLEKRRDNRLWRLLVASAKGDVEELQRIMMEDSNLL